MKLNTILSKLNINKSFINHNITGLFIDSRKCINNSIFFMFDTNKSYLAEAINNGAKTIINTDLSCVDNNINYIKVYNVKKALAIIAKIYYNDISRKMKLIGITGTNGKTSTSTLGYSFFEYIGLKSMLIGSNGIFYDNKKLETNNTTPDILTIYEHLLNAYKLKIKYVFMEVSSIGIEDLRIDGLIFNVLVLTNLKQDHLDYHKSLNNYYHSKQVPFLKLNKSDYAVINIDDENSFEFIKHLNSNIVSYGLKNADISANILKIDENGSIFTVNNFPFKTNLIGEFNVYNCLAVLSIISIYKLSYLDFSYFLNKFNQIDGRMNKYIIDNKNIIIDYAHTSSAVEESIKFVRNIAKKKLYIIIGCGGNREKEKRFMIGKLLNNVNANIILTTDNPRFEEPIDIIKDIKKNINKDVNVIIDRKEAIISTLKLLEDDDYLLILGKGCEPYIDVKGIKYKYNDLEVINEYYKL